MTGPVADGLADALHRQLDGVSLLGPGGRPGVAHRLAPRHPWGRRVLRALVLCVAVATGTAGVVLALAPPRVAVRMTASQYQVGQASLRLVSAGQFSGDGALVVRAQADGTLLAAGDAVHAGVDVSGECLEDRDRRSEQCIFDVGSRSLGALDTWTSGGWQRRYDDGVVVRIAVASPVPVPFLVGR
jgi:hypothetical protein